MRFRQVFQRIFDSDERSALIAEITSDDAFAKQLKGCSTEGLRVIAEDFRRDGRTVGAQVIALDFNRKRNHG